MPLFLSSALKSVKINCHSKGMSLPAEVQELVLGLTFLQDRSGDLFSLTPNHSTTYTKSHSESNPLPGRVHNHDYRGGDRSWSAPPDSNGGALLLPPASTRLQNTTRGHSSSMGGMNDWADLSNHNFPVTLLSAARTPDHF